MTRKAKAREIGAYGEMNTVAQWEKDRRCPINPALIRHRLSKGSLPEKAISVPRTVNTKVELHGEKKLLSEWARDPRCKVRFATLLFRVGKGMALKEAMTLRPERGVPVGQR